MDGWSPYEVERGVSAMTEADLDLIMNKLTRKGFDEIALKYRKMRTEQVRFSRNSQDLYNDWDESDVSVFAARGKRTVFTSIKDFNKLDETIERIWVMAGKIPENPLFEGLNPQSYSYPKISHSTGESFDLQDMSAGLINSAVENGAERTAGVVYNKKHEITVKTNYNECTYETGGLEVLIRSFRNEFTGQEARHFGKSSDVTSAQIEHIGMESSEPLSKTVDMAEIQPGKYKVLMSPYVIGNIISYSSSFLSYYSVESGLSCFSDLLNKDVSSPDFSLVDDPLDREGVGFRLCDDEGTPARKNMLIRDGVLESFLHSYSTSRRSGSDTTANAGIVFPTAWQLKIPGGNSSPEELLSEMDEGLMINNCWYTRYQDYREGVFSTVPRDGVFFVKNGEIQGAVKGIRISDSIPSILSNVSVVGNDVKNVKWWEEIASSSMPSVLVDEVKISRGF